MTTALGKNIFLVCGSSSITSTLNGLAPTVQHRQPCTHLACWQPWATLLRVCVRVRSRLPVFVTLYKVLRRTYHIPLQTERLTPSVSLRLCTVVLSPHVYLYSTVIVRRGGSNDKGNNRTLITYVRDSRELCFRVKPSVCATPNTASMTTAIHTTTEFKPQPTHVTIDVHHDLSEL